MTAPALPYDRLLGRITLDEALATPPADSLFVDPLPSGHPRIVISTTIEVEGHQLAITFNDTPVDQVLAILRRQARPQPAPRPHKPRRTHHKPRYEAVWSDYDFDDAPEPDPRGAAVVQLAQLLLSAGQAAGWSNALETARRHYDLQEHAA